MKNRTTLLLLMSVLLLNPSLWAQSAGTAFTYQGRLMSGTNLANGLYDFSFRVYDDPSAGTAVSANILVGGVFVTNGYFTQVLDFGSGVFNGEARWLQVGVRDYCSGGLCLPPRALSPRQAITPTPYALVASGINGLRVTPTTNGAPNVVGGASVNWVASGVNGATIAGGGAAYYYGPNAFSNSVSGDFGTIGGGQGNRASGLGATVSGGGNNVANGSSAAVGGGGNNLAEGYATLVAGGLNNRVSGDESVVVGGLRNTNLAARAGIVGGEQNRMGPAAGNSAIGGGYQNQVDSPAAVAAGGWLNQVSANANNSVIGGGAFNVVGAGGWNATVSGGANNTASGRWATIPGGKLNQALGDYSFAAGNTALALHSGAFTWADSQGVSFASTGADQFLVRAQGGFGINTNAPQAALHVVPGVSNLAARFEGEVSMKVLTITGGADLAEPFPMVGPELPKGSVVSIDREHPGRLKLSQRAYDTRVAGIVSGANGINPGLSLQQLGALAGGQHVALSGRVYVQADATSSAIEPGDLLTTSDLPGHAMKVRDPVRAQGAILGKAMSSLESGRGLVLVLVTLQ